ncbi:MAG: tRNA uridine-5-carboxymethylaminomethyl(34) synthesis GTPase MnmE [Magnetococcales bacterium]|nr:tRNA uridine-5-carboxymethylaminomethyl(34) synthesis GTPase MnmE [Magnetococcales bacterium]NGZ27073.1 tRNA uridine-5-carboxymethylaminomethyl(34) synthesis GTPase MnmE [Magnetococcales bacterium]
MVRLPLLEDSPIVALATPAGVSGVAVLRLSGAAGMVDKLLPLLQRPDGSPLGRHHLPPRRMQRVSFMDEGEILDTMLAVFFPAPHSFTGEEMVELHGHGAPVVVRRILALLHQQGIRAAGAGEFSLRACRNGKMNLVQAEAMMQLLHSSSLVVAREASRQMGGSLSNHIFKLRDRLLEALIHMEAMVDFAEEEIDPADGQQLNRRLTEVVSGLQRLQDTSLLGRQLSQGVHLVIAGRPNVGKSSLFNRLVGEEKAIVTPIAGTTRDMNDAQLTIRGIPVCLVDTAGLRESVDMVEQIGVSRSRQRLTTADGILWLLDASQGISQEDMEELSKHGQEPGLLVWNKRDCQPAQWTPPPLAHIPWPVVTLSCRTGEGVEDLLHAIATLLAPLPREGGGILMAERHRQAVELALQETRLAQEMLVRSGPLEIASLHCRAALAALEEMVGVVSNEDILQGIFSQFCIGK